MKYITTEHLTKLLRDSSDLQESEPDKSAYWHLQQLRSELKQLTTPVVSKSLKDKEILTFGGWLIANKYTKMVAGNFLKKGIRFSKEEMLFEYNKVYLGNF
jgi:hypothetical protein